MVEKTTSTNAVATEEDYEFCAIPNEGRVNIANLSYGSDEATEHTYTVTIENGQATHCSCPGHEYGATTKHQEAVEDNTDVISVADPDRCSNGHDFCPGPAAIDVERSPEDDGDLGCFDCWMAASEEGER